MNTTAQAPYWRDYLARERTMCSVCKSVDGAGWVRIGEPLPAGAATKPGVLAGWIARQRAAFRRHVAERHPNLRVRWAR